MSFQTMVQVCSGRKTPVPEFGFSAIFLAVKTPDSGPVHGNRWTWKNTAAILPCPA